MKYLPAAGGITVGGRFYFLWAEERREAAEKTDRRDASTLASWGAAVLRPYMGWVMDRRWCSATVILPKYQRE